MGRHLLSFVGKVAAVAAFFTAWWWAYALLNARGVASPRAVSFAPPTAGAPELLLPWTAVLYVAGGVLLPLVPFYYYRTWPRVLLALAAYALASGAAFACYWLWPVGIERPTYAGPGVGLWLMREVVAIDAAANCTPSSHAIFAILPATLVQWRAKSRSTRAAVWAAALAVCATTVTTGQHYFIDPVAGAVTALAAAYAVRRASPRGTV
jgi:hypothetical protein